MAGSGAGKGHYTAFYRTFLTLGRAEKGAGLLGVASFKLFQDPDTVDPTTSATARSHLAERDNLTGAHRLKLMFSYDVYGNLSPEISMALQAGMMGMFTGTAFGGFLHSRESYLSFIEKNQGTAFQNMHEARKDLQSKVTIGFGRGAWMWGWRLALFCSSFMLFTGAIQTYRNKVSILEYSGAGSMTGFIFKLKQGPRASLVGALLGGALGTLAGTVNWGLLYLTGTSANQLRQYHYESQEEHQTKRMKAIHDARKQELDILTLEHQRKVSVEGHPLGGISDTEKLEPHKK